MQFTRGALLAELRAGCCWRSGAAGGVSAAPRRRRLRPRRRPRATHAAASAPAASDAGAQRFAGGHRRRRRAAGGGEAGRVAFAGGCGGGRRLARGGGGASSARVRAASSPRAAIAVVSQPSRCTSRTRSTPAAARSPGRARRNVLRRYDTSAPQKPAVGRDHSARGLPKLERRRPRTARSMSPTSRACCSRCATARPPAISCRWPGASIRRRRRRSTPRRR